MATRATPIGGRVKSMRHWPGPTTKARKVKPLRMTGASRLIIVWPDWIMNPKMPAKTPRSSRLNHAAFVLTMPGAPQAWM
jgi:hypothetical protein